MRILLVSQYFWPETFRVNDLALGLVERGHEVTVLTGMPNYPSGRYGEGYRAWGPLRERWRGVEVWRVPLVPRRSGRAAWMALNYLSYAALATLRAAFTLRRFDAALVFQMSPVIQAFPALWLRATRGLPVVTWVQDLWPESMVAAGLAGDGLLTRLVGAAARAVYRHSDRLLGQSEAFLPRLAAAGAPAERLGYVPNWAEAVYEAPPPAEEGPPPWPPGGFTVLFAGNLGRIQALDTILDAAERLRGAPGLRWAFAGGGQLEGWLREEAVRRGLAGQVTCLGRLPVEAMPALFARADALLVSLKPDPVISLTIPSKLQSYLAAGRPVLASLDGEGARVVEAAGAGLAAPAGDAGALADRVGRLMALPPGEREAMGARGRAFYQAHFHRDRCLDEIERSLADLVGRRP